MRRWLIYWLIQKNQNLGFRRSPMFEQGMVAKVMTVLGAFFFVLYLLFLGLAMGGAAIEDGEYGFVVAFMPLALLIDFGLRFMVQQTPDMQVKPYLLQPVSKFVVIEQFLLSSVLNAYNFLWLAMFIPYTILIIAAGHGVVASFWLFLALVLMIMLNSQVYLMLRTLIDRSVLWWLVAVVVYSLPYLPALLSMSERGFEQNVDFWIVVGEWCFLLPLVLMLLLGMLFVNRKMQFAFVYEEIAKEKKDSKVRIVGFGFLSRYGQVGEYLKLEVKSLMRNKVMCSQFWMSLVMITIFSVLCAYTPMYDGRFSTSFWCFYCFSLYSVTSLGKIMGPEGNYIDLLLTHEENILALLKAKYYFQCAILLVPMFVMLPAVFEGKFAPLMVLSFMLVCTGPLFLLVFQLAVYNKQTIPLDQKLTGKGNLENGIQLVIKLVAMFVPVLTVLVLQLLFDPTTAYLVQAVIGLLLTLAHPWWLRNIYQRMMRRKYENLEGFMATR